MKNYWQNFYKKNNDSCFYATDFATDFVFFTDPKKTSKMSLIELGSGNGRDSYLLGKTFKSVIACDYAHKPVSTNRVKFYKEDLTRTLKRKCPNVVYSRFFLHCLTNKEIISILEWTKESFVAEFRIKGDEPKIYKHKRHLVDPSFIIRQLTRLGFEFSVEVGRGYAEFMGEDPLVMRVYAKKIKK